VGVIEPDNALGPRLQLALELEPELGVDLEPVAAGALGVPAGHVRARDHAAGLDVPVLAHAPDDEAAALAWIGRLGGVDDLLELVAGEQDHGAGSRFSVPKRDPSARSTIMI
jgi:hypothetical protein